LLKCKNNIQVSWGLFDNIIKFNSMS